MFMTWNLHNRSIQQHLMLVMSLMSITFVFIVIQAIQNKRKIEVKWNVRLMSTWLIQNPNCHKENSFPQYFSLGFFIIQNHSAYN